MGEIVGRIGVTLLFLYLVSPVSNDFHQFRHAAAQPVADKRNGAGELVR
ncbi:MAG: hypothetical protein P8049_12850 [Gemmatimonadota bacterium]